MNPLTPQQVASIEQAKALLPESNGRRTRYPDELKHIVLELSETMYLKDIAEALDIPRPTLSLWLKKIGNPHQTDDFISVLDTAVMLKVSVDTVYDAVRAGELPGARRLGDAIRIHKPTLIAWFTGEGAAC